MNLNELIKSWRRWKKTKNHYAEHSEKWTLTFSTPLMNKNEEQELAIMSMQVIVAVTNM